jgi:hypothetical protein
MDERRNSDDDERRIGARTDGTDGRDDGGRTDGVDGREDGGRWLSFGTSDVPISVPHLRSTMARTASTTADVSAIKGFEASICFRGDWQTFMCM